MLRIMFLFLVFGLLACSPADRPADKSVVAPESNASETTPEPNMYVEYLWCSNGENYSKEAGDARNAMWVDAVNSLDLHVLSLAKGVRVGWVGCGCRLAGIWCSLVYCFWGLVDGAGKTIVTLGVDFGNLTQLQTG